VSASDRTAPLRPPAASLPEAGLAALLVPLCNRLGLAGARLVEAMRPGAPLVAVGQAPDGISLLEAMALAADQPLVIADMGAEAEARFYAGLLLPGEAERPALLLSLFDTRPRRADVAERIAGLMREVLASASIARLERQIDRQKRIIEDFEALETHRRDLFDRASATGKMGIWQYDLLDGTLYWTNGVYDIFELPRGSAVTRQQSLGFYTETSRGEMEAARNAAIASCSDFSLTVEIVTARGNRRWMRLTGAVESRDGVAHRIFGMKQDITEEKLMSDRLRYLAEYDAMTGLANRALFNRWVAALDDGGESRIGALLLIDLDGFKQVNDTHGHALGDECLRRMARRLSECCADVGEVARVGGDEFAVLTPAGMTPEAVAALAETIISRLSQPVLQAGQALRVGATIGIAFHRGGSSDDLFRQADSALYAAKAAGKGTCRVYGPEGDRRAFSASA